MPKRKAKTARDTRSRYRVRAHRQRMRAKGMRLLQIWVPDTRTAAFKRRARLDSLAIANNPHEAEDQAFVDAISEGVLD